MKVRLIPLVLFNDWKMVKTIQFSDIRNYGSPVAAAKTYDAQRVDEIMYLDIRATEDGREPNYQAVSDIVGECFCPVAVGGGISTASHVKQLLSAGADKVVINTAVVENPMLISEISKVFGSQCIVVSIDVYEGWMVHTCSGTVWTHLDAVSWASACECLGAGEILLNSVSRDGTEDGYDLKLLEAVVAKVNIPVIIAGGAGKPQDLVDAVNAGASAVAAGSLFLYTEHSPISARKYMEMSGLNVRKYSGGIG